MRDIITELKNIKKTTSTKSLDMEVVDQLKKSDIPILLWGCGNYAEYIYHILKRNKIKIEGVFIDHKINKLKFHEFEVLSFDEINEKYTKIIIVRANGNIEREVFYRSKIIVDNIYSFFDLMGFGWHLNEEKLDNYSDTLNEMYNEYADDESKESFIAYLKSRYLNDWTYIQAHVCQNMYFPEFIEISKEESVVDCGAFNGDTLKLFLNKTSEWKNYIAFEPSNLPYLELNQYIEKNNLENIKPYKLGIWDKKTTLSFKEENDISRIVEGEIATGTIIEVDSIDNLCKDIPVTYIKMDLEGSEFVALNGAKNIILKNKPKLAISIYHKPSDLVNIFRLIKKINLEYKFYFRIHTTVGSDAVLYAI
jgi:FkbM family methyltransferase